MAKRTRQIIRIDEEKCDGCGLCATVCVEGAIEIVGGKAKLVSETYCDGLGACLGECPRGAISFETREAEEFDEAAAMEHLKKTGRPVNAHLAHTAEHVTGGSHKHCAHPRGGHVCPSARTIDRTREPAQPCPSEQRSLPSELRQWPVKLHLVNPGASFLQGADLLVAADCAAFACGSLHPDFIRGRVVLAGCPKFDDLEEYLEKLTQILQRNEVRSVTIVQMEVPCCSSLARVTRAALEASGKKVPSETVTISLTGGVIDRETAAA